MPLNKEQLENMSLAIAVASVGLAVTSTVIGTPVGMGVAAGGAAVAAISKLLSSRPKKQSDSEELRLIADLHSSDEKVRRDAVDKLNQMQTDTAIEAVADYYKGTLQPLPRREQEALRLIEDLHSSDEKVRRDAVNELNQMGTDTAIEAVTDYYKRQT